MKRFLVVTGFLFLASLAWASDSKTVSPIYKDLITVPSESLLTRKARIRKKRRTALLSEMPKQPMYNLFFEKTDYENFVCKIQGREAFLAVKALISGKFYIDINVSKMVRNSPLSSAEEVMKCMQKGKEIEIGVPQSLCLACETEAAEWASPVCGHMCLCKGCSDKLEPKKCPICRQAVSKFIRIYPR